MTLPERPLGEVLRLAVTDETVDLNHEYPIAGVYGFGRGLFQRGPIRGDETSYAKLNRLITGRLVMSRLKAFEGALTIVPPEFEGWYLSPEFPTFCIDPDEADERYLANLCAWPELWSRLNAQSKGVGARKVRVTADRLLSIKVPLPDLPEQRRIAARLDTTLSKVDRVASLLSSSQQLKTAIRQSRLEQITEERPLGNVLSLAIVDEPVDPDHEYPIAGVYSFGRGLIRRPTIQGTETAYGTLARLHESQLVMSKLNAWEGALAVVPQDFSGSYVSPEYPAFDVDTRVADPAYIAHLVRWPALWERLTPRGSMVRRKRISPSTLLATKVPLPDLPEQRRVARQLDLLDTSANAATVQRTHTEKLKLTLLSAAFGGRL